MKRKYAFLALALVLIILGAMLSNAIDTDFGAIKTERICLVDDDGYTVTAALFVPKNATAANPAPAMIICPGGDCASDIGMPWANELARRGYVVALADYTGSGDTEANPNAQYWTANGAMELDTLYDFLEGCAFVDAEKIGCGGHSMGSLYSYRLSTKRNVKLVISDVVYSDAMPTHDFDFVQITATNDEGIMARLNEFEDIYFDPFMTQLFGVEKLEPNVVVGEWGKNARVFYQLNQTHQDDMISGQFISLMVQSTMNSMPAPNPIDASNMTYGWKIVGLGIAIIGVAMMLFSLAGILLDSDLFSSLKLAAPEQAPGFEPKSKKWWLFAVIYTLIPVAFFFPGTGIGNKMASNSLFQLGTTPNGYMVWTLLAAAGMLVYFLAYHFLHGKKNGGSVSSYGFATSDDGKLKLCYVLKSAVLSLILFLAGYFVILMLYRYAKTDLHIWTSSLRPLNAARSATMPWYFLAMVPYFAMVMLAGNSLKVKGDINTVGGMVKNVISSTLIALVGMTVLLAIHEVVLRVGGKPMITLNFAHFYLDLLTNTLPTFSIASALCIYIRKKTNSFYAGILIGAAIVAYSMVSSNCIAMIIS